MAAHLHHEESPVLAAQRRGTASDAEYLQSATREWIGGVVALAPGSRPLPEAPLPELLANGAILHHVGRIVTLLREGRRREVLPPLRLRASGLGPRSKKFADKADVDYFLRVCRDAGLGDVDLFTASAVCGEGPTREIVRVCRCIRTFSVRLEELQPGVFPKFGAGSRAAAMSTASTGKKASLFSGLAKPGTPGGGSPLGSPRARDLRVEEGWAARCWGPHSSGRPCSSHSRLGGVPGGRSTSENLVMARRSPRRRDAGWRRSGRLSTSPSPSCSEGGHQARKSPAGSPRSTSVPERKRPRLSINALPW